MTADGGFTTQDSRRKSPMCSVQTPVGWLIAETAHESGTKYESIGDLALSPPETYKTLISDRRMHSATALIADLVDASAELKHSHLSYSVRRLSSGTRYHNFGTRGILR